MSAPWQIALPNWPTPANDYNRSEPCHYCGATGLRLQPIGRGELCCYRCVVIPKPVAS